MDVIKLLNIIKIKLFQPRKKIVFDTEGNKTLIEAYTFDGSENMNLLSEKDLKLLREGEGWNVADRDFVEFKCTELYKRLINNIPVPSAPFPEQIMQPSVNQKTIFYSQGIFKDDTITFFSPGLVLKKNFNILDFTLYTDKILEEEIILNIKNNSDSKITQISKIKPQGKQLFTADAKYKLDQNKIVVFEINLQKLQKINNISMCLQLTVEI